MATPESTESVSPQQQPPTSSPPVQPPDSAATRVTEPGSHDKPGDVKSQSTAEAQNQGQTQAQTLPPLSPTEFRLYNKHADMMTYYHDRFRRTWTTLYTACTTNKRPSNLTITQFINLALQFVHHLTGHHDIEEAHIFPVLATRMPQFSHKPDAALRRTNPAAWETASLMVKQHKVIHAGLVTLEAWLSAVKSGERDFRLNGEGGLQDVLDEFGDVLWLHLDEEVRLLGAESMRQYWTKDEIRRMNF